MVIHVLRFLAYFMLIIGVENRYSLTVFKMHIGGINDGLKK